MFTRVIYAWNDHRTAVVGSAVAVAILSAAVTGYSLGRAPGASSQLVAASTPVTPQIEASPVATASPSPRATTEVVQGPTIQQPVQPVEVQAAPPEPEPSKALAAAGETTVAEQPQSSVPVAPTEAAPRPVEQRRTITGIMKLEPSSARSVTYTPQRDPFVNFDAPTCGSKYKDVQVGTSVTVYDAAGDIIGTGAIDSARWVELRTSSDAGAPDIDLPASTTVHGMCELSFSVGGLRASEFYGIEVAHRGKTIHSAAELAAAGWRARLTLV